MNSTRIAYTSRPDPTPDAELSVLATCFRYILDCHAKKMAAEPDATAEVKHEVEVSHVKQ
jgi:hypothetical protein